MPGLTFETLPFFFLSAAFLGVTGFAAVRILLALQTDEDPRIDQPVSFTFDGHRLLRATDAAMALIGFNPAADWTLVRDSLGRDDPALARALDRVRRDSTRFDRMAEIDGQSVIVTGEVTDGLTHVKLCPEGSEDAGTLAVNRELVASISRELEDLRGILNNSPMLAWRMDDSGEVIWANRAYLDTVERLIPSRAGCWPLPLLFSASASLPTVSEPRRRLRCVAEDSEEVHWYDTHYLAQPDGGVLMMAVTATPVVKAEEALRNFVQTLTKTFAHLPTGLAIFDRQRQLALFNPALCELTRLDPEWLTKRPTLLAFLDRLRDNRIVPEPKDYGSWRRRISAMMEAAECGLFEEDWTLPSGQMLRVTGRPHPEGAVALLFDDITNEISLRRRFRAELELGQSLIDSMDEAIAVFSAAGTLSFSNARFAAFWGGDPGTTTREVSVIEVTRRLQEACSPTPIWGDLRSFVDGSSERSEWCADVRLLDGALVYCRFAPLAGGATLCAFAPADKSGPLPPLPAEHFPELIEKVG